RTHVDRRDATAIACKFERSVSAFDGNSLAVPGVAQAVKVKTQDHADVEERLIADRTATKKVLNRLFMAIGCVTQFGLGQLLFDHRRLDTVERLGTSCGGRDRGGGLFHGSRILMRATDAAVAGNYRFLPAGGNRNRRSNSVFFRLPRADGGWADVSDAVSALSFHHRWGG